MNQMASGEFIENSTHINHDLEMSQPQQKQILVWSLFSIYPIQSFLLYVLSLKIPMLLCLTDFRAITHNV